VKPDRGLSTMWNTERTERLVDRLDPSADFNFEHFRMRHMLAELLRPGLPPGTEAPDFDSHPRTEHCCN